MNKVLIGLTLLFAMACNKSERETPSGLKYKVIKEGTGVPVKPGDILLFNFVFKDSKDSVWRTTYESDFPVSMPIDTAGLKQADGMTQLVSMLTPGDSVVVKIPIKQFFNDMMRRPIPPEFDSTLIFTYHIKAEKTMTRDSFMVYQQNFFAKKQAGQKAKDSVAIESYLAKNNIVAQKTPTGVYYVITQPGKGENGKPGQKASVNYAGYTLEGQYFDTSIKAVAMEKGLYDPQREQAIGYKPYEVVIDQSQVIMGWHESLKVMNKGAKAKVIIPSALAYGPQRRSEIIKENEVLIFDLELVDLKDEK